MVKNSYDSKVGFYLLFTVVEIHNISKEKLKSGLKNGLIETVLFMIMTQ